MKALVVAAGIVFWTLVLGIAWLAFFPGSDAGEPVAILQIEPGPAGDDGAGAERTRPRRPTRAPLLCRASSLRTPLRQRPLRLPATM